MAWPLRHILGGRARALGAPVPLTGSGWIRIEKPADQDNGQGNTTFAADTDLLLPLPPESRIIFRGFCNLVSTGNGVQGGMQIRLSVTAGGVYTTIGVYSQGAVTTLGSAVFESNTFPTNTVSAATNTAAPGRAGMYKFEGEIVTGAFAGSVFMRPAYASLGAGGAWVASIIKGSYIEYFTRGL